MNHLRFLRYVDETARSGSIRLAAQRLHVAASAVNRRILDIEAELGTPLFERLPRGMRLTAAGELFVHYIRSRRAALDQVMSEIEDLKGLRRGRVGIAASQALARRFLPEAIAAFQARHPLVDFDVQITDYRQASEALRAYDCDLSLVFNPEASSDIEPLASAEQRLVLVMASHHPLALRTDPLALRDCVDYPIVLAQRELSGRQLLERFLSRSSIKLRPVVESNSFEFLLGYLLQGEALSFQIAVGVEEGDSRLTSRELSDRGFPRGSLVLAHLRGRALPVAAQLFADLLVERMSMISRRRTARSGKLTAVDSDIT
jgi:DNA-binding transcriptional LysR family regulator